MEDKDKIQELSTRLDHIIRQQKLFQDEIQRIQQELLKLSPATPAAPSAAVSMPVQSTGTQSVVPSAVATPPQPVQQAYVPVKKRSRTPWEEFIGTNLLNKVGIAILVLGIGFGAKYSIDHELINPLTRIILGYLAGIGLLAIAYRLRKSHTGFSAVLLSGGMAVLYFITFAAYDFYELIPQIPAFILMVMFTAFTVLAAVRYNMEVIGMIGLAGAYAVPLLLSDGSGRVVILFSYVAIINAGILFLAFRKSWKRLYYTAFALTWLTFMSWFFYSFYKEEPLAISLIFSTIYLVTFYTMFLAYKLIQKESFGRWDVVCMLLNSFIYFSFGYAAIDAVENGDQYLGLFTVLTALVHFVAVVVIYKTQDRSSDVFYFAAGMVLVFLTLAVPVQLDGNWVTIVWAAEAALLCWIGRTKSLPTYEKLSYPLMLIAFLSLLHDWSFDYQGSYYYYNFEEVESFRIFLNVQFLTSMLVGVAFALIVAIRRMYASASPFKQDAPFNQIATIIIPLLATFVFYTGIFKEIEAFWNHEYASSRLAVRDTDGVEYTQYNEDLLNFKGVWLVMFSAIFGYALYFLHMKVRTNFTLIGSLAFNVIVLFAFVTAGLLDLSTLRASYLEQSFSEYFIRDWGHILIRYGAMLVVVPLLWFNAKLAKEKYINENLRKIENLYLHLIALILLSSELVHWLDMARVGNSFKLSLSILWGAYALFMIVFGLSRDVKHIRVGGMVLFAVTLVKLFAYDMADMSTILRTIVMITLGALLLIASFIYNKYKRSAGNETQ